MTAAAVIALINALLTNLPAAITTGQQVIQLLNEGYRQLQDAIGDKEVTPEEVDAMIAQIVANSQTIQSIE